MNTLNLQVNDQAFQISPLTNDLDQNLLSFLRSSGFSGCKQVCGEGGCGACTVIVSQWNPENKKIKHRSVTSCLVPLATLHQSQITTIEGLSLLNNGNIHPICDAFYQLGASQCGFCTPGFILSFLAKISNFPKLEKKELESVFDGNLCRCTGYRPIMDAASAFCADPLAEGEYQADIQTWREIYKNCEDLDFLFPNHFRETPQSQIFKGSSSSWSQPTEIPEVLQLKNSRLGDPLEVGKNCGAQLVGGNTDLGCQDRGQQQHVKKRIYMDRVQKLGKIHWEKDSVEIGAGVTIGDLLENLKDKKKANPGDFGFALEALLDQCRFFANGQIRNMATVGGGLMNFSSYSDLIPVWVATGATAHYSKGGQEHTVALQNLYGDSNKLDFDPNAIDLLISMRVPFSVKNQIVSSYKYARRRMDSITFLSAGLSIRTNPDSQKVEQAIFCFDGLGVPGMRARKTEEFVEGKVWTENFLPQVLKQLQEEIRQENRSPLPERLKHYQERLTAGALTRFFTLQKSQKSKGKQLGEGDESSIAIPRAEEPLILRYPKVAHRSNIQFEENAVGLLGKAIPHRNAKNQTTGAAKYTIDHDVPNCLYGAIVTSPVASGKISSIDPAEALQHPDVLAFYSAKDIPGKNAFGFRLDDEEVLATDEVGYVGQPLGILVAKTDALAKESAKKVKVSVVPKEPLLQFSQAIAADSFHGRKDGYLVRQGDLQKGFEESDLIVEGEVEVTGQSHFYLEPQSALVLPRDDGFMVYSSTQSPSNVMEHVSKILNIPRNKVDVEVGRLGGGFGGKQLRAGPIAGICALAAFRQKRPVKLHLERHEDMAYCPGRSPVWAKYRAGFSKEGEVKAAEILFYLNGGFTSDYSADIAETATLLMDNCYHLKNIKVHGHCLKMNYGSYTSTRGFGKPQASAIIETVLDHGASELNLDTTDVRTRNLYKKGDRTITNVVIKDDVMEKCWNHLLQKSDYKALRKEVEAFNRENLWLQRGLAAVSSKGNMGFIESDDINRGIAIVQVRLDGTVSVNHSGCEMGQGINTRMAQVAAHHMGVGFDDVTVTDTQSVLISNTPPTTMVASDLIGKAIIQACDELNQGLSKYSGTFQERVQQADQDGVKLSTTGVYTSPRLSYDYEKQEGEISYFFVWGAALSLVEVDMISGSFRILKSNVVQDCGKSLNPHLDIGQAEGGFMFGVGYYTMEEPIYSDQGKLITDNVSGYKIPSCGDVPLDWDIDLFNYAPSGDGLHNSKGIGEANTQLGLSAYFAINDAVKSARASMGMDSIFSLGFPASVDRVSEFLPNIEDFVSENSRRRQIKDLH